MNNFKKIGLTALAASLVSVSAHAGEMSVAGGASIGVDQHSGNAGGKNITMGNQITFTGGGELDNGLNVALSFTLDQADNAGGSDGPFDGHSIVISSDSLGAITVAGEGQGNAQSALDTTAAGDIWDNSFKHVVSGTETAYTGLVGSDASTSSINYTLPTLMDDLSVAVSYSAGGAAVESSTAFGVTYTGVEGLSVSYGEGEAASTDAAKQADLTSMSLSYAIGSFTAAISETESDMTGTGTDEELSSFKVSYTVSDNLSVSYGEETHETAGQTVDEEFTQISASYTTGGMTLSAAVQEAEGLGNNSGAAGDADRWKLGVSFAF
ncbi:porin [Candidatus Pelagibacter ubique]|nr:porin [Candidatus Pelagibacter ubique]